MTSPLTRRVRHAVDPMTSPLTRRVSLGALHDTRVDKLEARLDQLLDVDLDRVAIEPLQLQLVDRVGI